MWDYFIRLVMAVTICLLVGGLAGAMYWEQRGYMEIAAVCFANGGKSVTRGWSAGTVYCNK